MTLVPFWLVPPQPPAPKPGFVQLTHVPVGLGVTAFDLDDAIALLRSTGYLEFLPRDMAGVGIQEDVRYDQLPSYVQERMGPIVVRGLWYPLWRPATNIP